MERITNQPKEVAARIRGIARQQPVEIDQALLHVRHWLHDQTPEGQPIERTENARTPRKNSPPSFLFRRSPTSATTTSTSAATSTPPTRRPSDVKEELGKLRKLEQQRDEVEKHMDKLLAEPGYTV